MAIETKFLIMWAILPVVLIVALVRIWKLYKIMRIGPYDTENRMANKGERIKSLLVYGVFQKKVMRDLDPGIAHGFIFWAFVLSLVATGIVFAQMDFGIKIFQIIILNYGNLILEIIGLFGMVGVILVAVRRYVFKPDRLDNTRDDAICLALVFLVLFSGFILEGLRIASGQPFGPLGETAGSTTGFADDFFYSPVGNAFAMMFQAISSDASLWMSVWEGFWWVHLLLAFAFIAYFPYSKLMHIFTSPANTFFRSLRSKGEIESIDIENSEVFGKSKIEEFSWKHLFDGYACTKCGRCQDFCPAYRTGKPLNPKTLILNMKDHLLEKGPVLLETRKKEAVSEGGASEAGAQASTTAEDTAKKHDVLEKSLIKDVITEDFIWDCTTCRACMEQCPVFVEHIPKIIEMRRNQILMESEFPQEMQGAFQNWERNFNPWPIGWSQRADWAEGLEVKKMSEDSDVEYLFYVGCTSSFDDRNKRISRAMVNILNKAGVSYAILGTEEHCCGETARRMGNEYLAQILMQDNVETLKRYNVKKIITACPHCFNTFKNEYPQFGGEYEVVHHTEMINRLMKEGKVKLKKGALSGTAVYHDSCYLGRYNDIYDEPRSILAGVGASTAEMKWKKDQAFCCGAGGGRMWMEETKGERINEWRTEQAMEAKADTVCTACPYCMTMFEDGIKAKEMEERMKVLDIAEVVEKALE